jgi:dihydrodipicolinate synthase/N-acetylneuraminate lyase
MMNAKEWFTGFAAELGVAPPTGDEIRDLLQLAGESAHASERLVAPVTCWLIARAGVSPAEALQILEKWKARNFQQPD